MAFTDTDQAEILKAVLRFYRGRLSLPDRNVYPCVEPFNPPVAPPGGDFWIAIAWDDGDYPFDEQDDEQLREDAGLKVIGFTRMQGDSAGREENFLLDPKRGASAIKRQLLLLVGEELTTADGSTGLLASRVTARRSISPNYDASKGVGWVGVVFGIDFDWKLPGADDGQDD